MQLRKLADHTGMEAIRVDDVISNPLKLIAVRSRSANGTAPFLQANAVRQLSLRAGVSVLLLRRVCFGRYSNRSSGGSRRRHLHHSAP